MKQDVLEIIKAVDELYVNPKCELVFSSNYELLVAVILSAQCTDKRVNQVTSVLFKEYNTPEKMITLSQEQLEEKIRSCGFFHNKAKHILDCSKDLIDKYNGEIPSNKKELKNLAGVGEKTANVVLATAFNVPAIAVDTHVLRVSNRLGLVKTNKPHECEQALMKKFNQNVWGKLHLQMVLVNVHREYVHQ